MSDHCIDSNSTLVVWVRDYLAVPRLHSEYETRVGLATVTAVFEQVEAGMEKYKPERDLPEGTYADSLRQLQRFRIVDTQKRYKTIVGITSRGPARVLPGRPHSF